MDRERPYSALFVGNSYTYYHQLGSLFCSCARSAGCDFAADTVASGGYHLGQYLYLADPMHREFEEKIARSWDVVFLQEHSVGPILDYDGFTGAVRSIAGRLPASARVVLFETWGRREDSGTLAELGMTAQTMTDALAEAYRRAGAELGLAVSPVGEVFRHVHTHYPRIGLYEPDGSHPSPAGSYLAALIHLFTVTGALPSAVTCDGPLEPTLARALRGVATEILTGKL